MYELESSEKMKNIKNKKLVDDIPGVVCVVCELHRVLSEWARRLDVGIIFSIYGAVWWIGNCMIISIHLPHDLGACFSSNVCVTFTITTMSSCFLFLLCTLKATPEENKPMYCNDFSEEPVYWWLHLLCFAINKFYHFCFIAEIYLYSDVNEWLVVLRKVCLWPRQCHSLREVIEYGHSILTLTGRTRYYLFMRKCLTNNIWIQSMLAFDWLIWYRNDEDKDVLVDQRHIWINDFGHLLCCYCYVADLVDMNTKHSFISPWYNLSITNKKKSSRKNPMNNYIIINKICI